MTRGLNAGHQHVTPNQVHVLRGQRLDVCHRKVPQRAWLAHPAGRPDPHPTSMPRLATCAMCKPSSCQDLVTPGLNAGHQHVTPNQVRVQRGRGLAACRREAPQRAR